MTRYHCILADPPWSFRDKGSRIAPEAGHYETMSLSAIIGLGDQVRTWAHEDCHLWLCAPNAFVIDGSASLVAEQWGFVPKQVLTWCKDRMGMGHWMRNSTEQILFCTRGRLPALTRNVWTHFVAPVGRHSEKPDELYRRIERLSPGPRLEMFARRAMDGWETWGDQAPAATLIGGGS